MTNHVDYKKYFSVFFITAILFFAGFYLSNMFNNKKIDQLKSIQEKISIDILSSETQFSLLSEVSCQEVSNSVLSQELSSLAEKLDYGERTIGINNPDIISLRRYYSLLEIKDYLLMTKLSERCKIKFPSIIYFYSNDNCADCGRQWSTISALRDQHPEIRAYVFEYQSDLSAVQTLISMFKVPNKIPAMVINGNQLYSGFTTLEDLKALFPDITKLKAEQVIPPVNKNLLKTSPVIKQ